MGTEIAPVRGSTGMLWSSCVVACIKQIFFDVQGRPKGPGLKNCSATPLTKLIIGVLPPDVRIRAKKNSSDSSEEL